MALVRPGKLDITEKAMEIWNLPKGSRVLDVGCGDGTSTEYVRDKYGFDITGIDMSLKAINEGKERTPDLDLKLADGEWLDDYSSFTFDGIMMECSLSLINLPDEALHEAYCVMKKGGRLFISDLYIKDPDPKLVKAVAIEAERQSKIPHQEGDCEKDEQRQVDFRYEGAFIKEPLIRYMEDEVGFKVTVFEDRSKELDEYVGEMMLNGEMDTCVTACKDKKGIGYFMLIAEKPVL
jgi:ubiquinone/menaquinone biosynthesis C-methylase UbiE